MLRKAHTDRNQCRRCCGKRHPVHRLLRNLRQMPARHTPARADDDAENNRVFKDVDEGMHELPGVDFPARFSEFHTSRGRCPKQQNVKIMMSEIVGIASAPRLTCTMGTPSCTLLPKMPPMPVMTWPVLS